MVSIVLATYDRAATLPRAIESVLRQSAGDWELIIVDDGSTDDTGAVLADVDDPRIRVFAHAANRGVAAARNTGFDQMLGDWFTILDSDDEMTPDALAAMLECAGRTGATSIRCNCIDSVSGRLTGSGRTHDGWLTLSDSATLRGEHWGLMRTSLLGGLRFDERLPGFEETVWLKIDLGARLYYLHRALRIYHTEGSQRLTASPPTRSLRDKVSVMWALGEDAEYLRALQQADPRRYGRTMARVRAARLLRPLVSRS